MKEIGDKLREAREGMGISLEEAAEDLKIETTQVQNLEDGNMEVFKDIYYLKYFIRDYSKYLGLDKEDLVNEFNEYLFDYTSKISLDDIRKAKNELKAAEDNKVRSPYTMDKKRQYSLLIILSYIGVLLLIAVVLYFTVRGLIKNNDTGEGENSVVINEIIK